MSFFDNLDGLSDIANIYGVRQRHTAISNQIENRSLIQEQNRIAREHRDAEREVVELLRKQAESAAEKLEQKKEARKRLSQLVGALQGVTRDYTIDNIFRFAWIQSWQKRLSAADLFDEFSDIRVLDDIEQRLRAEAEGFRAANKLSGDPTHWAEYLLNKIETNLSASNEVLQTHWFFDPYRQADILGEFESAERRFKALEQAAEASLKRCKAAKARLDELVRIVDSRSEDILKYRDGESDEITNDYNAAVDTLHSYEEQLRTFENDTLIDLRAKYDDPDEVTQITNMRRNFFETVNLVKPELIRDRVDGLVVDFESKVATAKANVPEWLLAMEECPEVFKMYLDITEPSLYPVCRRTEFVLNLLQGGVIGGMIRNELRRIQSFVETEGVVTCIEDLRLLMDSGNFLAAQERLAAISIRFRRILNLGNIKNRIDAKVVVLSRAESLRRKVKKSRMSLSRLIRHDKTKGEFQNEIQHLRGEIGRFPHSDLAISVGNILKEIEDILRSY